MPYTAPVQFSPSATKPASPPSPSPVRTSSAQNGQTQPTRPNGPRSYSSTSYMRRHRRCPSVSKAVNSTTGESVTQGRPYVHGHSSFDPHASLRQSPPPTSNTMIPKGAIISPPESAPNSSDDEAVTPHEQMTLDELDAAIRSIQLECDSSTSDCQIESKDRNGTGILLRLPHGRASHAAESRKIPRSRSSTKSSIPKVTQSLASSPSESDRDDDEILRQQPMVRKKSGELVRPALRPPSRKKRPSSMPGTPTYAKNVHFDTQLEHIRHFLQIDKPVAVSANTSPVESYHGETEYPFNQANLPTTPAIEWDMRLVNFPRDNVLRQKQPVRLERMFLSPDNKNLIGVVIVANLAFHKHVVARFTFDYWKTRSEVSGEYKPDANAKQLHDGFDRFNFTIKLADQANLENKTMFICIRYNVGGLEYWDNNFNMNYQVDFSRRVKDTGISGKPGTLSASPHLATLGPRSRVFPTSNSSRPRSLPPSFDDFSDGLDNFRSINLSRDHTTVQSPLSLTQEDEPELVPDTPRRREKPAPQAFGNRYDFGVSLSATMRSSTTTQDRTTLSVKAKSESPSQAGHREGSFSERQKAEASMNRNALRDIGGTTEETRAENLKPSSIVSSKPHLESSVYKELVDKYCFFGSDKGSAVPEQTTSSPEVKKPSSSSTETRSRGRCAPAMTIAPYKEYYPRVDPAHSKNSSPRLSGSTSSSSSNPTSQTPQPSPQFFPYSRHQALLSGFLNESQTPTVIQG